MSCTTVVWALVSRGVATWICSSSCVHTCEFRYTISYVITFNTTMCFHFVKVDHHPFSSCNVVLILAASLSMLLTGASYAWCLRVRGDVILGSSSSERRGSPPYDFSKLGLSFFLSCFLSCLFVFLLRVAVLDEYSRIVPLSDPSICF